MVGITVIIPVKNQSSSLRNAVLSVLKQSMRVDEVIVVDGHSTDNLADALDSLPVRVVVEDCGTRGGAIMRGLEGVVSEFVAFTDADCIAEHDWLECLLPFFEPEVVGVGGTILNCGEAKALKIVNASFSSPLGSGNSVQGRLFVSPREVKSISGANSMYRLSVLRSCGGFNVHLRGAEDAELNRRIQKFGKLVFTPDSVVRHYHGRGYLSFFKRMIHYGEARVEAGIPGLGCVASMCVLPAVIVGLVFSPYVLLAAVLAYFLALLVEGIRLTVTRKLPKDAFVLVPVVLLSEHVGYAIGSWRGFLHRMISFRKRPISNAI
jgi:glycosyltransferase involved in cell wall biosynthesis